MLNRAYRESAPHLEPNYTADTSGQEVTSYNMLVQVVKRWVRGGLSGGLLRFTSYDSNAGEDIVTAISEVMYNDPYGYYVGAYILYESASDSKGPAINLSIKYMRDRPQSETDTLTEAGGREVLRRKLREAMHSYAPYLAVEMPFYEESFDPDGLIAQLYTQEPLYALGFPAYDITFYKADKSQSRILEFRFAYEYSAAVLTRLQQYVEQIFREFCDGLTLTESDAGNALTLHDALCELLSYDHDTAAYDALRGSGRGRPYNIASFADKKAVGEGYALAYKALCDNAGITAEVVYGERASEGHAWNIVSIDGRWYHVDAAMNDYGEETAHEYFLSADETMRAALYRWDSTKYPPCEADYPAGEEAPPGE
jgi:hypothetical protein